MTKRKPTKAVMEQFFKPSTVRTDVEVTPYVSTDPNCEQCGAHVIPSSQVTHVEWHLKVTKLFESKRDKL